LQTQSHPTQHTNLRCIPLHLQKHESVRV
jgi:hypothetical protein